MSQIGDRLRNSFKKINKCYTDFLETDFGKFAVNFSGIVLIYGAIINYVAWSIFGDKFTVAKLLGYGVIYYLINEELLDFIKRVKRC